MRKVGWWGRLLTCGVSLILSTVCAAGAGSSDSGSGEALPHFLSAIGGAPDGVGKILASRTGFGPEVLEGGGWPVHLDVERVNALKDDLDRGREPSALLSLASGHRPAVVFERSAQTMRGYSLSGHLIDDPLSGVTIVTNGNTVAGMVNSIRGTWTIRKKRDSLYEVQRSIEEFRCEANATIRSRRQEVDVEPVRAATADDRDEIDVLVLFTPAARKAEGGIDAIRALIDVWVTATNEAYLAGDAHQRIRLVAAKEVEDYVEGGASDDLDRLELPDDGYMDEIHAMRDAHAADLVHLVLHSPSWSGGIAASGFSWTATTVEKVWSPFSVSALSGGARVFAHELGHSMGLQHDRYVRIASGILDEPVGGEMLNLPFPYSHGYVNQQGLDWRTIMAYGDQCSQCPSLMRFSNPSQDHEGHPMGVPGDEPSEAVDGPADAVRSLNETRAFIANYRQRSSACLVTLSETGRTVGAEGATFELATGGDRRCSWSAWTSGEDFIAFDDPLGEVGDVLTVRVSPNDGFARVAKVVVGGELHTIRQEGSLQVASVCDRSPDVARALVTTSGRENCGAVTEFDLAKVLSLELSLRIPKSGRDDVLKAVDFQGLVELRSLSLSVQGLGGVGRLPDGLFDHVRGLTKLDLAGIGLTSIDADVFAGFSNLRTLDLARNDIQTLDDGMFAGLSSLGGLDLTGNPGAPFELRVQLERIDSTPAAAGPARVVASVRLAAPWSLSADIVTGDGEAIRPAWIPHGESTSAPFVVHEVGPDSLTIESVNELPASFSGIRTVAGGTLRLFTMQDQQLRLGGRPVGLDLVAELGLKDDSWTFMVSSSVPSVAAARLTGTTLHIDPQQVGTTTVTITAMSNEEWLERSFLVSVAGVDHGNTPVTATLLPVGMPMVGKIDDASDVDVFRIDLQGSAALEVSTSGPTDTLGELLDGAESPLISDDDGGPGGHNFLVRADLEPGIYYVAVSGEQGDYAVTARLGDSRDDGDHAPAATLLTLNTQEDLKRVSPSALLATSGSIRSSGDVDVFRLDVPLDGTDVTVRSAGAKNLFARLLDISLTELVSDTSGGDFRISARLDAGVHYVEVWGPDRTSYRVLAWSDAAPCACAGAGRVRDQGNNVESSMLFPIGPPIAATIGDASDADVFRIDLQGSAILEVQSSGPTDTRGELLDSTGAHVLSDDNSGPGGHNFLMRGDLASGIYYVVVDGEPGDYAVVARLGNVTDHGDTESTATLLTLYAAEDVARVSPSALLATSGRIAPTGADVDVFRLDVPSATDVTIRSAGSTDVFARLLDSSLAEIASDDGDGNFRIEAQLDAGIHYLVVGGHETGRYRVLAWAEQGPCGC